MSNLQITIPDFLARQAADAAVMEQTSVDHIICLALSSQLSAWQVRDGVCTRTSRGRISDLDEILGDVPDVPAIPGDEILR